MNWSLHDISYSHKIASLSLSLLSFFFLSSFFLSLHFPFFLFSHLLFHPHPSSPLTPSHLVECAAVSVPVCDAVVSGEVHAPPHPPDVARGGHTHHVGTQHVRGHVPHTLHTPWGDTGDVGRVSDTGDVREGMRVMQGM